MQKIGQPRARATVLQKNVAASRVILHVSKVHRRRPCFGREQDFRVLRRFPWLSQHDCIIVVYNFNRQGHWCCSLKTQDNKYPPIDLEKNCVEKSTFNSRRELSIHNIHRVTLSGINHQPTARRCYLASFPSLKFHISRLSESISYHVD